MPLAGVFKFICKWSLGVLIMSCDLVYDVMASILVLFETILVELFSVACVLVIDIWKTDEVMDPNSTPTRDNKRADVDDDDDTSKDDNTASSTESIGTNHTSESDSNKSDELRVGCRHLKQEYTEKKKQSRTQPVEIVGTQLIF